MKDPILIKINIINSIDGDTIELELPLQQALQQAPNKLFFYISIERFFHFFLRNVISIESQLSEIDLCKLVFILKN